MKTSTLNIPQCLSITNNRQSILEALNNSAEKAIKDVLSTLITDKKRIRAPKSNEKIPAQFEFLSNSGDSGEICFNNELYTFRIEDDGELVIIKSPRAGSEWTEASNESYGLDSLNALKYAYEFTDSEAREIQPKIDKESLKKLIANMKKDSIKDINEQLLPKKYIKEEVTSNMRVFMNTWENYNENGADGVITPTGWMSIDDAIEYCKKYAESEPFINDGEDLPVNVSEFDNAEQVLQVLKKVEDGKYDEDILDAIMQNQGCELDRAIEIYDSGDYSWYAGVLDDTDLAYAVIEEMGGLEQFGDTINNYIDERQMRDTYEQDAREMLRSNAVEYISDDEGIQEDQVTDDMIEDYIDANIDNFVDQIVNEDIAMAEKGELDLSDFFDYRRYGRDLSYDGYTYTSNGAIRIF